MEQNEIGMGEQKLIQLNYQIESWLKERGWIRFFETKKKGKETFKIGVWTRLRK